MQQASPPRPPGAGLGSPTLVSRPFHREGWVYEEKVDGWRMVAHKAGAAVKLVSRQGVDHTRRFPGIVATIRAMAAPTLVLDGEVAVFDSKLISRFEWLRHAARPDLATPPIFMAFDCLHHRGQDLRPRRLPPGATCWRTCWTARTWCCRSGAWPTTG